MKIEKFPLAFSIFVKILHFYSSDGPQNIYCSKKPAKMVLKVHMESLMICESRERPVFTFWQKLIIFVFIKCACCHKYGTEWKNKVCYFKRNTCSIIQAMPMKMALLCFYKKLTFIEKNGVSIFW